MLPDVITIDFETMPIKARPDHPPEPVGVSIKYGREKSNYWAWGHPTGNNCSRAEALSDLREAFGYEAPKLFFNAKFDLSVAYERCGIDEIPWTKIHDSSFLTFLADPHHRKGDLKSVAEDLLNWPPEERDELKEWILSRKKRLVEAYPEHRKLNKAGKPVDNIAPSDAGAWIFATPGDIVGRYACGDTDRTYALFEHLYPLIVENGMRDAYIRERRLLPILMENERIGMRVDLESLERDAKALRSARLRADKWLKERLGKPRLNINSAPEYAAALSDAGVVDDDKWVMTEGSKKWRETGGREGAPPQRSTSKDNLLPSMYNDPQVASVYGYRNRAGTCLNNFMEPWLKQGSARGGVISTNWHQTRGGDGGTRTGRPSTSNPNFLNLAKDMEGRTDGYVHPAFLDLPQLPLVRKYILPDEGGVWLHRDFDSQELRVFAHYESGDLFRKYLADPRIDVHTLIRDRVTELTGKEFERTIVKNINFGKIYGAGIPRIMQLIQGGRAEAQELDGYHKQALPGVEILKEEIKRLVRSGEPIRTWGGRCYYPEPPKNGRDFEYKLLNYEVQGGAADITKQAIIDWYESPDRDPACRWLLQVYDENNISAPKEIWREQMAVLKRVMEQEWLDVPMLSSPKVGLSWGSVIKPLEDKKRGWVEPEDEFIARAGEELGI